VIADNRGEGETASPGGFANVFSSTNEPKNAEGGLKKDSDKRKQT